MTVSGSGVGGNIGGMQQPSINEREQTAANEMLKIGAGLTIVKDTLEVAFYEVGGQIGRYPTNPSRPMLPPLITTRGPATSFDAESEAALKEALTALVNLLPPAIKSDYEAEMSLPLSQRNLNFVALDNVLTATATAIAWLQTVSGPSSTAGVAAEAKAQNLALPQYALEELATFTETALTQASGFLDLAGANYPQQDSLRNYARQTANGLADIQTLLSEAQSSGKLSTDLLALLSAKLSSTAEQYYRVSTGDDLSMLGIILASMASLTAALSLTDKASPTVFLSLALCSVGIESANSESGFVGPALAAAVQGMSAGLTELLMAKGSLAMQELLKMYITGMVVSSVVIANALKEVGTSHIPGKEPADVEASRAFAAEVAVTLLVNSGVVSSTISALVATFGLNAIQQQYMEQSLNLLALTTMVLAMVPGGDPKNTSALFTAAQVPISQSLNSLSELVSERTIDGTIGGEAATTLSIALGQAKIAMDEGDFEGFTTALFSPLETLGTSGDQLLTELNSLQGFLENLEQSLTTGTDDQTNTETRVNIVV